MRERRRALVPALRRTNRKPLAVLVLLAASGFAIAVWLHSLQGLVIGAPLRTTLAGADAAWHQHQE